MSGEMDLFWSRGDCEEVRVERIKRAMKNEGLSRDECARTKCKRKQVQVQASARCRWLGGGAGEREGGRSVEGRRFKVDGAAGASEKERAWRSMAHCA